MTFVIRHEKYKDSYLTKVEPGNAGDVYTYRAGLDCARVYKKIEAEELARACGGVAVHVKRVKGRLEEAE